MLDTTTAISGPALRMRLLELFLPHATGNPNLALDLAVEAERWVIGKDMPGLVPARHPNASRDVPVGESLAFKHHQPADKVMVSEDEVSPPQVGEDTGDKAPHKPAPRGFFEANKSALEVFWRDGKSPEEIVELAPFKGATTAGSIAQAARRFGFIKKYPRRRHVGPGIVAFNVKVAALQENSRDDWPTATDRDLVAKMIDEGLGFVEIATAIRAPSWTAVRDLAAELGLLAKTADGSWTTPNNPAAVTMPRHPPKRRKCITCGTDFLSEGPHHRMCTPCRTNASDPLEAAYG